MSGCLSSLPVRLMSGVRVVASVCQVLVVVLVEWSPVVANECKYDDDDEYDDDDVDDDEKLKKK